MTLYGGYGSGGFGSFPWGGGSSPLTLSSPYLVFSNPVNGAFGVPNSMPITFCVTSEVPIDVTTLYVELDEEPAIIAGGFISGYTGTITQNADGSVTVVISTHPNFASGTVYCVITVSDTAGHQGILPFKFNGVIQGVGTLLTKTWCDGNRIDLFWTLPVGVTQIRIRRSSYSYCRFVGDPGEDVYVGAPITAFIDGPGPVPANYPSGAVQSTTPLQENSFYYYTIFISYQASSPYSWSWNPGCQVEGLSIKPYTTLYGTYVYNWLPETYRRRDADPTRGTDQYLMRDYCGMLQCAVNLYRGWLEGLMLIDDPDLMPAGRMGDTGNINGLLSARAWDLGMPPEQSFDAGVLRRIACGIVGVTKQKGTCPGLVSLTKLFTTWDATCAEAVEPSCGVDPLVITWDGTSFINLINVGGSAANNPTIAAGSITVPTGTLYLANNTTLSGALNSTASGSTPVAFIIDAMGTFACVSNVAAAAGGNQVFTFDNPLAELRTHISGTGTNVFGSFVIGVINNSSFPWQFPSPDAQPVFGDNAFLGYQLKDSANNIFTIASATTNEDSFDQTRLTFVSGSPVTGTFTIAQSFDSSKNPCFAATLYSGEFSLKLNPLFDSRLMADGSVGPWSMLTGLGSITASAFAATPADVTIWVDNVALQLGTLSVVTENSATDNTQSWTTSEWIGDYLLPNWDQTKVFRIIANTATTLVVDVAEGGGVDTVATAADPDYVLPEGSSYVILSESDALKYSRLVQVINSFVPVDTRPFVKFTN